MIMLKLRRNAGSSLVGLLVAMSIMVLVLGAANSLFVFGVKTYQLNLDRLEVQENLRIGMDRLSREVRQAAEITSIEHSGLGRLTFKDPDGELISYRISKSGDAEAAYQLVRSIKGSGNNPVARYVTKLDVQPANAGAGVRTVHLTITGEKGASGAMDISTSVTLRN